jgi:hypothetical protein
MAATAGLAMLAGRAHAGSDASQPRTLPAFHAIDLVGTMQIEVAAGQTQSVQLVGDSPAFDRVLTTVKDGTLIVDTKLERNNHYRLKLIVSVPDVSKLVVEGTGSMKVTGIANNRLAIDLPGTGEIKVDGSTGDLKISVDGTGDISARKLNAKSATVSMAGTGAATITATESVDATVTGTGSIDIDGHPANVHKHVTGVGSIHVR